VLLAASPTWAQFGVPAAAMAAMAIAIAASIRWLVKYFTTKIATLEADVARLNEARHAEQVAASEKIAALTLLNTQLADKLEAQTHPARFAP